MILSMSSDFGNSSILCSWLFRFCFEENLWIWSSNNDTIIIWRNYFIESISFTATWTLLSRNRSSLWLDPISIEVIAGKWDGLMGLAYWLRSTFLSKRRLMSDTVTLSADFSHSFSE